ncbi:MAG: hypothetical protein NFW16_21055 [Candidatus Accumulibacter sp.]|uniref:hypothetical protein n=1 Tax=Accumulibacter sp. TaxID=2053492 RepID=UPI002584A251|nr:hypothetical protein [Accumulibacter sp.]MCM8624155.1 hypothetical protein [Accumulibacter sp.]
MVVQDNHSDAPLLPITGIERLHAIRPDRVDWVLEQTQIEAETRRSEQRRINKFVFIERIAGIVAAASIGLCGIAGGIYAGLQGHDWLGGIVSTATIGTLAVAFLKRHDQSQD